MAKIQIPIYATQSDLSDIAREVSSVRPLQFAVAGLFDQMETTILTDLESLLPFTSYLVFGKGRGITVRSIPQRNGAEKYAVDQIENPHTVVIQCGGLLDGQRLIAGQVGTVSTGKDSNEIYALFAKAIRRKYEKIKSYYVGPEAAQLLDKGVRLTPTAKSPETYDLIRQKKVDKKR